MRRGGLSGAPCFQAGSDLERDQASLKQVELLRAEVYRGAAMVRQLAEWMDGLRKRFGLVWFGLIFVSSSGFEGDGPTVELA